MTTLIPVQGSNRLFDTPEKRREMARIISRILEAKGYPDDRFEPSYPNASDDSWIVDSNNNWRVEFPQEHPNRVAITYRYNGGEDKEGGLAGWLSVFLGLKVIEKTDKHGKLHAFS